MSYVTVVLILEYNMWLKVSRLFIPQKNNIQTVTLIFSTTKPFLLYSVCYFFFSNTPSSPYYPTLFFFFLPCHRYITLRLPNTYIYLYSTLLRHRLNEGVSCRSYSVFVYNIVHICPVVWHFRFSLNV